FLFKFLVIGSAGTGKSCLLHHFIESKFKADSNHTIGVEFGSRLVAVGGRSVKLQIWDTAGQERFRSVTRSYYRGAAGALLVYDITRCVCDVISDGGCDVSSWVCDIITGSDRDVTVSVCDVINGPVTSSPAVTVMSPDSRWNCGNSRWNGGNSRWELWEFPWEAELMFLETSALTGENVEEAFLKCARSILNKIDSGELDPERMGSGIQYGDASLRQLRQPRGNPAPTRQSCGC
ncbi:PREDICTED: ras-related protein Rab-4B-like, partial [Sturnus vulgaris]|uniref:ras-related protein Rab-4B-like n=1 Tax=Sturnus vulgaris TaxID=9172 RepID=UPI00071A0783